MQLRPIPTPIPVPLSATITNPGDSATLAWAIVAGVAAVAAVAIGAYQSYLAYQELQIIRREIVHRSKLEVHFPIVGFEFVSQGRDGTCRYGIGINVRNSGNKGLRDFRVTVFLPKVIRRLEICFNQGWVPSFGAHNIAGLDYDSIEVEAGRIYAPDDLWICSVTVFAPPGDHKILWVIVSEDGRVPAAGHQGLTVSFPSPPPPTHDDAS